MKDNLAEVVCVMDRSGSMEAIREDAVGGFNSFLDSQKGHPGEAHARPFRPRVRDGP